ncbi:MAG: hypothetical protein HY898_15710 [Deltaproteobacteria bacterium]|nr:hypothetical protein [Deltaproteobacteria bacterium]
MPDSSPPTVCPYSKGCPLYPMFSMESVLHMWMALYCEADFSRCERYLLRTSGAQVPPSMMPNGKNLSDYPGIKTGK